MDDSLRYTGNVLYFTIEKNNKVMIWNKTLNCAPLLFPTNYSWKGRSKLSL